MRKFLSELVPASGPERILSTATLINTFGNGLFFTVSVLYFTRIVGFSAHQVGFALTLAGAIALFISVPAGHIADRLGPRNLSIGLRLVEAVLMGLYAFVDSYSVYIVIVTALALLEAAGHSLRGALVARFGGQDGRVRLRAVLRAVTNLGMTLGAACGGLALTVDTKTGYQAAILINAATIIASAVTFSFLENLKPLPGAFDNHIMMALRDKPYVALSALNAVLALHFMVLEIAIPLWIVNHTSAPRWMTAVVLIINTVVVTLFQIRASKGSEEVAKAAMVLRNAAFVLALAALIYGSAALFTSAVAASAILAFGSLIHVYGELRQSAGSWGIGFGLPPENAQGQYQGVWSLGFAFSRMISPLFLTTIVVGQGILGWSILAVILFSGGLLAQPLTRWALATKTRQEATSSAYR